MSFVPATFFLNSLYKLNNIFPESAIRTKKNKISHKKKPFFSILKTLSEPFWKTFIAMSSKTLM